MHRIITTVLITTFSATPLWAQDPPATVDIAQDIALLAQDDARCSDPETPDYSGEWCKGFRTGATFINLTSSCGFLINGQTRSFAREVEAATVPLDADTNIIFEAP